MDIDIIRKRVQQELKKTHKSVRQLAREIGVNQYTLSGLVKGSKHTRFEVLEKIAAHFGLFGKGGCTIDVQNPETKKSPVSAGA